MSEESNVFVLMSGDRKALLVAIVGGAWKEAFLSDWKEALLQVPEINPVTFPTREDARKHIAAKGYNQFTRIEVWEE